MRKKNKPPIATNVKGTLKRVLGLLMPYKKRMVACLICLLVGVGANIAGTMLLSVAINTYIEGMLAGTKTLAQFTWFMAMMAGIYLVGVGANYACNRTLVVISTTVMHEVRIKMFGNMQKLPISFFDKHNHGELMSRYTNDTDTLREMMSNGLSSIISCSLTILGIFVAMLVLSPLLTLIMIGMLAIMFLVVSKIGGKSGRYFVKQQQAIGALNGFIEEHIDGQKVVKVFNHEQEEKNQFDVLNNNYKNNSTKANTYANILMPIMGNIGYFNFAIISAVGAIFSFSGLGGMNIGKLASFLQFTRQFNQPISQISQQINAILMAIAGAGRVFELMDSPPEVDDGYVVLVNANIDQNGNISESEQRTNRWAWKHYHKQENTVTYTELKGGVEFENVNFSYDGKKTVLNNVSLYAKPGQKIAFVGSTGAGKTTITNLINRFYDVPDGKIRYDGININKIKKDDLRHSLAMVLQDVHLFTGTVMDNIRYGKLDATDEQCIEASKTANAHWFIEHLPQGYQTMLTADGANLSQGQKQLISIARAMVADPPVLILDEATSSIDTRTEALIEKGMDALMQGRTVFVIAHRLSTVRNSDAILVLENGEIIERGNHDELLEKQGKYYQLYTGVFELQ